MKNEAFATSNVAFEMENEAFETSNVAFEMGNEAFEASNVASARLPSQSRVRRRFYLRNAAHWMSMHEV